MRIYVGNLPYETSEEDLRQMFETHGEVTSVAIITDRFSGRSKGFGFVEMSDNAGAEAAIGALDESEMQGRRLRVNEARPREPRSGGGGGGRDGGGGGGRRDRW